MIRCSYAVRFAQVSLKYELPVTTAAAPSVCRAPSLRPVRRRWSAGCCSHGGPGTPGKLVGHGDAGR
ncbi:hypothetical protein DBP12_21220 [Streptomyces sp. CS014]|nr:hypothetical protein DBP12_21220 [Streptomyces sp. CS014]